MGLFSLLRSSSPKKAKPTAGEIAEQQQLLSPQVLIPAPPLPAPADPAPDAGVSIPLNGGSTAAAAAEFSTTDLPVNGTAADKLPTPPNSQGGTPTSSNRSWRKNGTKSPKMSDRDKGKLRAGTLAEEHVSTTAVAAAAAAASAADPADAAAAAASESFSLRMSGGAIAVAKPFGGPAARTAASSASSPPSHFEKKKRRNSRGLSYGMGFEEIGSWGQPEWSGAYTDRSAGQRGRPERAKDGTKNWVVPHPPVRPEDFEKRAEEAKPEVKEEKGSQYTPVPNLELHSAPLPAAPEAERPDFSGVWRCTSTDGCWDEYLKRCDVDSTRRALARGTDYGTGRSVQTIVMSETKNVLTISNVIDRPFRATVEFVQEGEKVKEGSAASSATPSKAGGDEASADGGAEAEGPAAEGDGEPLIAEARIQGSTLSIHINGTEQSLGSVTGSGPGATGLVRWEGSAIVVRYKVGGLPAMMKRYLVDELTMAVRVMVDDFDAVSTYQMIDGEGDVLPSIYRMGGGGAAAPPSA